MAGSEAASDRSFRRATGPSAAAVLCRLGGLAALSVREQRLLTDAATQARILPARRSFLVGHDPIVGPLLILSGWAARVRQFADGRRQVLGIFLPGDVVPETAAHPSFGRSTFLTITELALATAPEASAGLPGLEAAYRESRLLGEGYLLQQIARLGQLDARERIHDWLLEMRDRLSLAGLVHGSHFPLPATQEIIGDTLGLTSVHVNRTLQAMRREGMIDTRGGDVRIVTGLTSY